MSRQLQSRYITLTSEIINSDIRTAVFDEREHVVVPVIALIGEEVIWASNAPGPELVPSTVIAHSAQEWEGRPVVGNHPKLNGSPVSANLPIVYEKEAFGRISNSRFENGKLRMDAWLDPVRAEKVGGDAVRVIERARAGEPIEVSVGAWVEVDPVKGTAANGKEYVGVWMDLGSDHLSMLPEGVEGACSNDMGCGVRTASVVKSNDHRKGAPNMNNLLKRLLSAMGVKTAVEDEGASDSDIRNALWTALRAVEPGFDWVVDVFPESSTVIYVCYPENETIWYRRSYSVSDSLEVTLNDDKERVEPVTRYEPVVASKSDEPKTAECGCKDKAVKENDKETDMSKLKDLATRVIKGSKGLFEESDRATLEALSETRLQAMAENLEGDPGDETEEVEEGTEEVETGTEEVEESTPTVASAKTEAEWLAEAPESLRSLVGKHKQAEAKRRGSLLSSLKGAQSVYSEAQLKTKSTDDLEALAILLKLNSAPDYTGRGLPDLTADDEVYLNPPKPYDLAMARKSVAN